MPFIIRTSASSNNRQRATLELIERRRRLRQAAAKR
jgi:hypothetical protein